MPLKRKIDKVAFDALSKDLQKEYTEEGDGYILDLDGSDGIDEMRRAKDREIENAKKARADLKAAQALAKELQDKLDDADPAKDKDIKKLDAAHKTALAKLELAHQEKLGEISGKLSVKDQYIKNALVNSAATTLATKISTVPTVMSKVIAERFTVDFEGDEPKLVVLGTDGKPSSLTMEQLAKEFIANKEYAAIIIGSKASGSSAARPGARPNPGSAGNGSDKPLDYASMPPKDLAAHLKAQKEAQS